MSTLAYQKYFSSVTAELKQAEQLMLEQLHTDSARLFAAATHLITGGGKRLRPAFLLLTGKLFRRDIAFMLPMAAAMEIAHVGTLVHDDVVDASDLRRGIETVRVRYGERMSVYAGNFLFARALQLADAAGNPDIIRRLTAGCVRICAGEIQQLEEAFSWQQNIPSYLRRINKKTALLISLSCEIGAMQCEAHPREVRAMKGYGHNLGMAFQISDDVLDYTATEKVLGKPVASDLRNGLMTCPVLFALQHSSLRYRLRELIDSINRIGTDPLREQAMVEEIVAIVKQSGGVDAAVNLAERYAARAVRFLQIFPETPARKNLMQIAAEVARRNF